MQSTANRQAYLHSDYALEFSNRAEMYWDGALKYASKCGPPPKSPYQVEIHLKSSDGPTCLLRCVDCHGQFLRNSSGGLSAGTYDTLLDDLDRIGVPSLVLSGIYSDPSTDEYLLSRVLRRISSRWSVKLHTYGLGLSQEIQDEILSAAKHDATKQSYITISKTTVDEQIYSKLCRPQIPNALMVENDNIRTFLAKWYECQGSIDVRLNCRVTKLNGSVNHLTELLRWVSSISDKVSVRFTTDYVPGECSKTFNSTFLENTYMDAVTAKQNVDEAVAASKFPENRASFRDVGSTKYIGPMCYHSLLISGISTDGGVFPCPSTCSRRYDVFQYGDINESSFPEIWTNFVARFHETKSPMLLGCPSCAVSCEAQINHGMHSSLLPNN